MIPDHIFPSFGILVASLPGSSRAIDVLTLCCQARPGTQQVGEGRKHCKSILIFLRSPIVNFAIAEDSLDDQKRMLHFGPDAGVHLLDLMRRTVLGELGKHGDFPLDRSALLFLALLDACLASVYPGRFLLAVQKLVRYGNLTDIGGRRGEAVDQSKGLIDTDVHLCPNVPLVFLLGLVHPGITCIVFVLGRTRRGDNNGVHGGPFLEPEPLRSQILVDSIEDELVQASLLEELPEAQDGGFIRDTLREPQARKAAHRFQFIQCAFPGGVAEVIEQPQAVLPHHDRQRSRRAAISIPRVVLAKLLLQLGPWKKALHPLQEGFAPGCSHLVGKIGFGGGHLGHGDTLLLGYSPSSLNPGRFQSILRDTLLNMPSSSAGINHVAFQVEDLTGVSASFEAQGSRAGRGTPQDIMDTCARKILYLDPETTDGLVIELIETKT